MCRYTKDNCKVRHHQYDAKVVRDAVTKQVIKSNYFAPLCSINDTINFSKLP